MLRPALWALLLMNVSGSLARSAKLVVDPGLGGDQTITCSLDDDTLCASLQYSFDLNFATTGSFDAGNVFTAQLSDADGNFGDPVVIGSISATADGMINCTIPFEVPPGTGYRVRVVSSSPEVIGLPNDGPLTVEESLVPSVTITSDPPGPIVCEGASVLYTATATNTGGATLTFGFLWGLAQPLQVGPLDYFETDEIFSGATMHCFMLVEGGWCISNIGGYGSNGIELEVVPQPYAEIAYAGEVHCDNGAPLEVDLNGTEGGTFGAEPDGLEIDPLTGTIDLAASGPGNYTVTYTIDPVPGCDGFEADPAIIELHGVGDPCDDGDETTGNDAWNEDCECVGLLIDCEGVPGGEALPGSDCELDNGAIGIWDGNCNCVGTGITDPSPTVFSIYPNPAHTELFISTASGMPVDVQVHDLLGQVVLSKDQAHRIDLSGLVPGSYVLSILDYQGQPLMRARFVKQ